MRAVVPLFHPERWAAQIGLVFFGGDCGRGIARPSRAGFVLSFGSFR